MDTTKSFIKVHNFGVDADEFFRFDYSTNDSDLLSELVPNYDMWGDIGWMELEEYEYDERNQVANIILETKWAAPIQWLQEASKRIPYFENRLITMTTIQKDETLVTGVAVMDGEVLQNKPIFSMSSEDVGKHYDDSFEEYDLDNLDNQIWDSISKFVDVCEQFYLDEEEEND
ncbi:MAG: hypothetical protein VW270_03085 [Candidatus Poseidoniales archaeon]|jgi:hypothetical protein